MEFTLVFPLQQVPSDEETQAEKHNLVRLPSAVE